MRECFLINLRCDHSVNSFFNYKFSICLKYNWFFKIFSLGIFNFFWMKSGQGITDLLTLHINISIQKYTHEFCDWQYLVKILIDEPTVNGPFTRGWQFDCSQNPFKTRKFDDSNDSDSHCATSLSRKWSGPLTSRTQILKMFEPQSNDTHGVSLFIPNKMW